MSPAALVTLGLILTIAGGAAAGFAPISGFLALIGLPMLVVGFAELSETPRR